MNRKNPYGWVKALWDSKPDCFYCRTPLTRKNKSLDHYIPKAQGGLRIPENIVPACKNCNRIKGDLLPISVVLEMWKI